MSDTITYELESIHRVHRRVVHEIKSISCVAKCDVEDISKYPTYQRLPYSIKPYAYLRRTGYGGIVVEVDTDRMITNFLNGTDKVALINRLRDYPTILRDLNLDPETREFFA